MWQFISESFCKELNENILASLQSLHPQFHLRKEAFHMAHGTHSLLG